MKQQFFACIALCCLAQNTYAMAELNSKEIDLSATNAFGETHLIISAKHGNLEEIYAFLLVTPDIINQQDIFGKTALMHAAARNYPTLVRVLISRKANLDLQDVNGNTALGLATEAGNKTIAEMLIDYGASLNIQNNHGDTPLIIATKNLQFEILLLLHTAGANVFLENSEGETLLSCLRDIFSCEETKQIDSSPNP